MPSVMDKTELSADEFCDRLALRYDRSPTRLQPNCDGYGMAFTVQRAFSCEKGGLVISRHNELHGKLIDMASKSFSPSAVHSKPKINLCCTANNGSIKPTVDTKYRGDVLIRTLWDKGTDCILDMIVMDTDAIYYHNKDPTKVMEAAERLRKKTYIQPCLDQQRHFTLIVSVDGLVEKEARTVIKTLAENQAQKTGDDEISKRVDAKYD
jgi:hypothetical protein